MSLNIPYTNKKGEKGGAIIWCKVEEDPEDIFLSIVEGEAALDISDPDREDKIDLDILALELKIVS